MGKLYNFPIRQARLILILKKKLLIEESILHNRIASFK
jgi:hypothetical protein